MSNQQVDEVIRQWRESAPYWQKHASAIRKMFAPLSRALINAASIQEGQSVIDIAGGAGEPALAIAEKVGPQGSVVSTDAVAEMLDAARREAASFSLNNITFKQSLADDLPFDGDSFDAAVCRLGAMFFAEPENAIREMLRVIRPGGRIALAVWGDKQFNPFFSVITQVMSRYVQSPPEDADAPGAFRFAEPGKLSRILDEAGAVSVTETVFDFHIEAPLTADEFWQIRSEISDTLREKVSRLSEDQLASAAAEVKQAALPFFAGGTMRFPARTIIVAGCKPG